MLFALGRGNRRLLFEILLQLDRRAVSTHLMAFPKLVKSCLLYSLTVCLQTFASLWTLAELRPLVRPFSELSKTQKASFAEAHSSQVEPCFDLFQWLHI